MEFYFKGEKMGIREYARLVAEMRTVQKRYFRTRLQVALQQSKALEKKVDEETTKILDETTKVDEQQGLFD